MDLLEDRNHHEPSRGEQARRLIRYILINNIEIVMTEIVFQELRMNDYEESEIRHLLKQISCLIVWWDGSKFIGHARTIAAHRGVPAADVVHALCAKDSKAILITRDRHYLYLTDICKSHSPETIFSFPNP